MYICIKLNKMFNNNNNNNQAIEMTRVSRRSSLRPAAAVEALVPLPTSREDFLAEINSFSSGDDGDDASIGFMDPSLVFGDEGDAAIGDDDSLVSVVFEGDALMSINSDSSSCGLDSFTDDHQSWHSGECLYFYLFIYINIVLLITIIYY